MADMGVFNIDPGLKLFLSKLNEHNLHSFAKVREDPTNDEQIELYIYCCLLIFQKSHSEEQLERAIQRANGWLAVTPADHSDHSRRSSILDTLSTQMHQYKSQQNIREAAKTIPQLHPDISGFHPQDIGVQMQPMAIQALIMAQSLTNRAIRLAQNYTQTGLLADLDEAIAVMDRVVNIEDGLVIPSMLGNFASMLLQRFLGRRLIEDLNRAIDNQSKVLDAASPEDPEYFKFLLGLNSMLLLKCKETSSTEEDLDRAIKLLFKAMDASPRDPIDRSLCLNNIGSSLSDRFEKRGSLRDLDDAIKFTTKAVDLMPQNEPYRALYLSNLARLLGFRFDRTKCVEDNDRAIKAAADAVESTPLTHIDRLKRLRIFKRQLNSKFKRTSLMEILNRMIQIATEVLDLTPRNHPDRATRLSDLGHDLGERFQRTGLMEDLHRAIEIVAEAADATPRDHPDHFSHSHALANLLSSRFEHMGTMEDIDRAIELGSYLRKVTPEDTPGYYRISHNLGTFITRRLKRRKSIKDLDDAINLLNVAINGIPQDSDDYVTALNNLGIMLETRFQVNGSMEDLDHAIEFSTRAANAISEGDPRRATCLDSLASQLCERFEQKETTLKSKSGVIRDIECKIRDFLSVKVMPLETYLDLGSPNSETIEDLDRAIKITETAVKLVPQDHQMRGSFLSNLAIRLEYRNDWKPSTDDLSRQLEVLVEGWHCNASIPSIRMNSARSAARILASQENWKESSRLLKGVISLLPTISPRYLNRADMQSLLADLSGLSSTAAAISINAEEEPQESLRILELSRGVIAGLLMDMRGNISDLKLRHPDLADRFTLLRDELDTPTDSPVPFSPMSDLSAWESKSKRSREATREFDQVVEIIRTQPGFHNFLRQLSAEDLIAAAGLGPIVMINMDSSMIPNRSDAFLINGNGIQTINLPGLTNYEVTNRTQNLGPASDLTSLLEWLWHIVCRPCLDALGFKGPVVDNKWPHVWWIPTGSLSQLPFHAAGIYTSTSKETVLDRVISSYASSIRELIHNRQRCSQDTVEDCQADSALLVAMQNTPGLSTPGDLPYAGKEVDILSKLCPSLRLNIVTPRRSKSDVLKHLQRCKLFHFAGHGRSDLKDPSNSFLYLEDWEHDPLTVENLRESRLHENPPFLAYLSACSTGTNKVKSLSDEGIHLVSAFQLAGFRHVVGTLWEVSDKHCVDIASVLYETLRDEGMTDIAVSRGLHFAIRALRDKRMEKGKETRDAKVLKFGAPAARSVMDYFWVPYVHFGA